MWEHTHVHSGPYLTENFLVEQWKLLKHIVHTLSVLPSQLSRGSVEPLLYTGDSVTICLSVNDTAHL